METEPLEASCDTTPAGRATDNLNCKQADFRASCRDFNETEPGAFEIAGVCRIRFKTAELHKKYFGRIRDYLENLLRESSDDLSQLFCVDTQMSNAPPPKQIYDSLNNSSLMEDLVDLGRSGPFKTCFNCLGDHHMNECPEPINKKRVSENRRKLQITQTGSNVRFFEDENRSSRLVPGSWSRRLLEAMGVRKNEIPPFVYRMRVLGYPPGWLTEAEDRSSGLKLFDGSEVIGDHDDASDGEVAETSVRYNVDKLISVPGFNVGLQAGIADQAHMFGMPAIQQHQSREAAIVTIQNMMDLPPRKRLKIKLPSPGKHENNEPLLSKRTTKSKSEASAVSENQLSDAGIPEGQDKTQSDEPCALAGYSGPMAPTFVSLNSAAGTPIPECVSQFGTLPSADNWRKGISEHIPFENLPGATGTFEKMRGLLFKIKDLKKPN